MAKFATTELTGSRNKISNPPHLREFELLSLCARTIADSETRDKIGLHLESGVDWEFLISSAHDHRVSPLVYRTLATHFADRIPQRAINRLRHEFYGNAKRNLFLTAELLQIIDVLAAHNISVIPYKGPVLAMTVYGEVSLRQFSDLDVIVRRVDAERAKDVLISRGYQLKEDIGTDDFAVYMQREKHVVLLRDDGPVYLELHWAISTQQSPIQVNADMLWENLTTVSMGGRDVNFHTAEDLLLILSIHGAKHRWEHLGWLCDIAEILRSPEELNWTRLFEKAAMMHCRRILLVAMSLARTVLGAKLPEEIIQKINADHVAGELAEQVMAWQTGENPVAVGELEHYFMKLRERSTDRARVAVNQMKYYLVPTSRERESFPLRGPFSAVLYIIRPFRLVWEHGLGPFWRFLNCIFRSSSNKTELKKVR